MKFRKAAKRYEVLRRRDGPTAQELLALVEHHRLPWCDSALGLFEHHLRPARLQGCDAVRLDYGGSGS